VSRACAVADELVAGISWPLPWRLANRIADPFDGLSVPTR
jgi:hypothetical protein